MNGFGGFPMEDETSAPDVPNSVPYAGITRIRFNGLTRTRVSQPSCKDTPTNFVAPCIGRNVQGVKPGNYHPIEA